MFALLWVQSPGSGRVSLRRFPADADDARPAVRGMRPITGSSCSLLCVVWTGNGS